MHLPFQEDLLDRHLHALLGDIEPAALGLLRRHLEWLSLPGGGVLMNQGDPGDSMYLVISGRLRAYLRSEDGSEDGSERMLREMGRGQVIGEMSLYTDEPRSASVVAIRDSVLVRLGKAAFRELLASSSNVTIVMTRQIIQRLQNPQPRSDLARPVTIALVPVSAAVDTADLARSLAAHLQPHGRVCVVTAASIDTALGQAGIAVADPGQLDVENRIGVYLDQLEADHEFVLLQADDAPTAWTRRCARRCDEVLLLADADQPPVLHDNERVCLMRRQGRAEAAETLVLLHPADRRSPQGTRRWLARRPVAGHLHIRPALGRDMARLARFQSGTAVGLVLAGGGARGLAHLGILRALAEAGLEIDCVAGTSIGSVMAGLAASDQPLDRVLGIARRAFIVNPTGDFNLLPMLSLIRGRRLRQVVGRAIHELVGHEADIEDLWKTCHIVASNYTRACEQVLSHGPLLQSVLASIAIPGALPPVPLGGDLLCDGGTFNNFPVDVMRAHPHVGRVIGVDLSVQRTRRPVDIEVPGSWALLVDRFRPRARRRYRMLPSLMAYLMNVTVLYSTSRVREARRLAHLYFNPALDRVGMLHWHRFDDIVRQGHAHGREVLGGLNSAELRAYRPSIPDERSTVQGL